MTFAANYACFIAPLCNVGSVADSSCDNICSAGVCPGGTITLPAGYTGSIGSRKVQTKCNSDNRTYSCYCGASNPSNLKCATGYYGTASYSYNYGMDSFTGCSKCPSNATCTATGFSCKAGYYKSLGSCVSCGTSTGNLNATSDAGSESINQCYIPAGVNMSDVTGTFSFSSKCYYTGGDSGGGLEPQPLPRP